MTAVYFDPSFSDDERRQVLYRGDFIVLSPNPDSQALTALARALVGEAFAGLDPETAQLSMPVQEYAARLAALKPKFIHHPESKRLIAAMLQRTGCDSEQTYFDVPRMRTSTSDGYLTTGIAYAFHPHRDTWYSAPLCQLNWWTSIMPFTADNGMAMHTHHWQHPVANTSHSYNYQNWNATNRFTAVQHIGVDTRIQPKATAPVQAEPDIRFVLPPGALLLFSGAQLHSSIENLSGKTRFSIDFRTMHLGDARALRGAPNLDSNCTGTAMPDFLRVSDLAHLPDDVVQAHMAHHPLPPALVCGPPAQS
jgi:Phytanoyl-CoA dioxygenase (PhyH)